jgi:two-component SAPR family response regulator
MSLLGKRILIMEDEFFLALCVGQVLEEQGCAVIGPATSVQEGLDLVEKAKVDGAILDINLNGEMVYPVAKELMDRNIPFVFTTGYRPLDLPSFYYGIPRLEKPVEAGLFIRTLKKVLGKGAGAAGG